MGAAIIAPAAGAGAGIGAAAGGTSAPAIQADVINTTAAFTGSTSTGTGTWVRDWPADRTVRVPIGVAAARNGLTVPKLRLSVR
jgi:hypothetical protein